MSQQPDVFFTPVPDRVLAEMLRLAGVGHGDVLYDLGCGDGRIVIHAVQAGAKRGVGVDIDPACVAESQRAASRAGVADRTEFRGESIFSTDLRPATVIALYLLDSLNVRLRPTILAECAPGTRVVSYSFEMGEWECDAHTPMAANGVSLWIVPANFAGRWEAEATNESSPISAMLLDQVFQKVTGQIEDAHGSTPIREARVRGNEITFSFEKAGAVWSFRGQHEAGRIRGVMTCQNRSVEWNAARDAGVRPVMRDGRVITQTR